MVLSEQYRNVNPCEACQLLGQASRGAGDELLLVTLSPNPEWNAYGEQIPAVQLRMLKNLYKKVYQPLSKHFDGYLMLLSEHYELNKTGNLHSHCLFEIHPDMCTPANIQTISKIYHKVIGRAYVRSSICADVRRVTDDGIYKYINKENVYPPNHPNPPNLLVYMPQNQFIPKYSDSDSDTD